MLQQGGLHQTLLGRHILPLYLALSERSLQFKEVPGEQFAD